MSPKSNKTLILFDLDGVIIDSRSNMEKAWGAVCEQTGTDITFDAYFAEIGRTFPDIMARLGLQDKAREAEMAFRMASMEHLDLIHFYDGVPATLTALKENGFRLGIVTSKDTPRSNAILALLPVDFTTIQTPKAPFRGKPAPDHLLMAMAEAQVDPAESVYFGDMNSDYEAACRAGIDYIHASWGYGDLPADHVDAIDEFSNFLSYLGIRNE